MTRPVRFLASAAREFAEAAEWYEAKRSGLGVDFVAAIDTLLARIAERPEASPLWRKGRSYRRQVLQRFPFIVFFRLADDDSSLPDDLVFSYMHSMLRDLRSQLSGS